MRSPSTATTCTRCSPIGFGRSGDRVLKTPSSGFARSPRGWTRSTSRSAWCSQVNTSTSESGRMSVSASATPSSKTIVASGAPSSPCFGAEERSPSGDSTRPTAINTKRLGGASTAPHSNRRLLVVAVDVLFVAEQAGDDGEDDAGENNQHDQHVVGHDRGDHPDAHRQCDGDPG